MSKRIVILTGTETRHEFFRKYIAQHPEIEVLRSYCEDTTGTITDTTKTLDTHNIQSHHLQNRSQVEKDFFGLYNATVTDTSHPVVLQRSHINNIENVDAIRTLNPDLIVAYGCSLIKSALIDSFPSRILNVHLGLSPYYRGSGTNFWPLVNNEPEYVGATFMYMDEGIDTGNIIHQIRPDFCWGDTPSQIGNRLIQKMAETYARIIIKAHNLPPQPQLPHTDADRLYSRKDFNKDSVETLYANFKQGLIDTYLTDKNARDAAVPIIENPLFTS